VPFASQPLPQAWFAGAPQPLSQGAEQQRLVFFPKQPPASAVAIIEKASANEKKTRMLSNSSKF